MAPFPDSGLVLYAVGVLLGIAAVAYFARDLFRSLSITVKTALLLAAFAAFGVVGSAVTGGFADVVAYALGGGTYLVFLWYGLANHDVGEGGVFAWLAASSGLFLLGGYLLRSGTLRLSRPMAGAALASLAGLAVALVVADRRTDVVETTVDLRGSVTLDGRRVTVGTATVSNRSPFRRHVSLSSPVAHLTVDGRRVTRPLTPVAPDDGRAVPDALSGHETVHRDLRLSLGGHAEESEGWRGTTRRVERVDEAPETLDTDVVAVTV